jgi:hypothetical protein
MPSNNLCPAFDIHLCSLNRMLKQSRVEDADAVGNVAVKPALHT